MIYTPVTHAAWTLLGTKLHKVRATTASPAQHSHMSYEPVIHQCTWTISTTFSIHYLRDVTIIRDGLKRLDLLIQTAGSALRSWALYIVDIYIACIPWLQRTVNMFFYQFNNYFIAMVLTQWSLVVFRSTPFHPHLGMLLPHWILDVSGIVVNPRQGRQLMFMVEQYPDGRPTCRLLAHFLSKFLEFLEEDFETIFTNVSLCQS